MGDLLGESLGSTLAEVLGLSVQGSQFLNKKSNVVLALGSVLGSRLGSMARFDGGIELDTIGAIEGTSIDLIVGDKLGLIEGFRVGSVDGGKEMLGLVVGWLDGSSLGTGEGLLGHGLWLHVVGCPVGWMVGEIDGILLGE